MWDGLWTGTLLEGIWKKEEKTLVELAFNDKKLNIPIVVAQGEKYSGLININYLPGIVVGPMIFISEKTPVDYRKFVALHELIEYFFYPQDPEVITLLFCQNVRASQAQSLKYQVYW